MIVSHRAVWVPGCAEPLVAAVPQRPPTGPPSKGLPAAGRPYEGRVGGGGVAGRRRRARPRTGWPAGGPCPDRLALCRSERRGARGVLIRPTPAVGVYAWREAWPASGRAAGSGITWLPSTR